LVTREELRGECDQSCQQYRSNNGISPKPTTKRSLIFRIELSIFNDELSAHRTPPSLYANESTFCTGSVAVMAITKWPITLAVIGRDVSARLDPACREAGERIAFVHAPACATVWTSIAIGYGRQNDSGLAQGPAGASRPS
jgi:hypothetical protein